MRASFLTLTAFAALTLGGCSQVSGWLKGNNHASSQAVEPALRGAPDQSYAFSDAQYDVEIYDTATVQTNYAGYDVVLYESTPVQSVNYTPIDPRDAEFVMLNGVSKDTDWRNCETRARGYLFISEYDFSLDPDFEVCMRNKGYVLATEAGPYAVNPISAKTAGLRGFSQPGFIQSSYNYP